MMKIRGFSMLELLIAMVIIGAAMIPFLGMMLWGHQKTELTVDQVVAENVALTYLEFVHSKDYKEIDGSINYPPADLVKKPDDFKAFLKVEETFPITIPGSDQSAVTLECKLATVTVTWKHMGKKKELKLADVFIK
ncbi:MAG: type II secretion system protein [bacterium]|jgi:prepilin-type N-terminal cleavage/methylation domain-containing protein|nr:type II secretion system protein [bacterium]